MTMLIRALKPMRQWLEKTHPDVRCSKCAKCGPICGDGCFCLDEIGKQTLVPYDSKYENCKFEWEICAAEREAFNRLHYVDVEHDATVNPMVKDVFKILEEGLYSEIKWEKLDRKVVENGKII